MHILQAPTALGYPHFLDELISCFSSILAPLIAYLYNLFMGGVDRADALRAAFTTRLKSNKWWHTLFFWVLDRYCAHQQLRLLQSLQTKHMSHAPPVLRTRR
ncbi:hypothetical protein RI054_16g77050 [Pseudoscourfieldia marina]